MLLQEVRSGSVPFPLAQSRGPNTHLRFHRENRGWSQRRLAELIDVDPSMIAQWENGQRGIDPSYQQKLIELFGKDAIELGFLAPPEPEPKATEEAASPGTVQSVCNPPPGYSPLKYQRLLRGWSQQDVADELYQRCCAEGKSDVGVSADLVSRWELGKSKPCPLYRKHLCQLYHMTTEQLGLL
jgi:transcriptional regulator with XRE-family HTH domain